MERKAVLCAYFAVIAIVCITMVPIRIHWEDGIDRATFMPVWRLDFHRSVIVGDGHRYGLDLPRLALMLAGITIVFALLYLFFKEPGDSKDNPASGGIS
ncbi:hypothetical protein [Paenibacillus protaetiae]|uniref:Uncharacterized protein n=1 Tax=Paenibacillus protaetiae TaxID=2509456 RepID=A0A4P6EX70_9BACL|nr:hypothetical protein [Paenibacillus protaetiae]QAY67245.1 hypothetical protein ET464_13380 [Paenibacillus protaetiae]